MDDRGGVERDSGLPRPNRRPADPFAAEIQAAQRGCPTALGRLFEHFQAYLLHVANRRVSRQMRGKIAPSSIVQVTLLQLSQSFDRFSGTSPDELKAWMRGALVRNVADANRRFRGTQKRDPRRETSLHGDSTVEPLLLVDGEATPACDELIAREDTERLTLALARLSQRQRQVILLRCWSDRKWADVGRELGCTEDAARQIWARAVVRLKNLLREGDRDDG